MGNLNSIISEDKIIVHGSLEEHVVAGNIVDANIRHNIAVKNGFNHDYDGKPYNRVIVSFPGVKNKILEKLNKMQRTHSLTLEKLIRDPYVGSIMIAIRHPFLKGYIKDLEKYLKNNNILLKYKINDYSKLAPNAKDVYHEVPIKASILNFTNNCLFTFRIRLVNQNDKLIIKNTFK